MGLVGGSLHNIPIIADLSGAIWLYSSVSVECDLGSSKIPEKVRRVFPQDKHTLLKSYLVERKCWLVLVRAARETIQDNRIQNEFSDLQSNLRKWVEL